MLYYEGLVGLWFLRPTANLFSSFYGLRLTPLGSFTSTTQRVPPITLISFSTFRTLKYSVSLLQAMKLTGHAWSHKAWCSAVINCYSIVWQKTYLSRQPLLWGLPCSSSIMLHFYAIWCENHGNQHIKWKLVFLPTGSPQGLR